MAQENLKIKISAIDKTRQAFNRVKNGMKSVGKAAAKVGLAVAAIGVAFVAAGKKVINFADDIAKQSRQIDISTKAFQEMRLAADLAGVSEEAVGGALAKLGKHLEEFRLGTGTLMTFLDKLGDKSFANLMKQTTDTEQAFKLFIKRMDQATSSQQKLALANAAFGRGVGQALSGMTFVELEKGIELAQKFGTAIDKKLLIKAEAMKDAFTVAAAVFKKQFFTEMLKAMDSIDLKQFATDMAAIAVSFVSAAKSLGKFFGIIKDNPSEVRTKMLAELQRARLAEINGLVAYNKAIADNDKYKASRLFKVVVQSRRLIAELDKRLFKSKVFKGPTTIVTDEGPLPGLSDGPDEETKFSKILNKLYAYKEGISLTSKGLKDLNAVQFSSAEAMEIYVEKLKTAARVQKFINDLRSTDLSISKEFEAKLISEAQAIDTLNRSLKKKKELLQPGPIQQYIDSTKDLKTSLEELAVQGANAVTDSLIGMMNGTTRAADAFKSMALSIVASMQKMIIKKLILDRVMGFISSAIGSMGGTADVKTAATGGPVSAGKPYLIGERGPELMVPGRSGTIVPNNALGGGGAVINQTINIQTGVAQTVRAEILTLMPQINQATKAAVLDARQRGGSFANGFA
jgi:hypothetical protein